MAIQLCPDKRKYSYSFMASVEGLYKGRLLRGGVASDLFEMVGFNSAFLSSI